MDDEPRRGRAKAQKLRVTFPDGTVYCYSSVKETFLATLRKIGADKLSRVELNVCRLPMFSETIYERYKDFMEPIGDGLYANIQGNTYNKYAQLHIINYQLQLGLQIDLGNDFNFERVSRSSRGMSVLEVKFPDGTEIGEESTLETFTQCIWQIGIDTVRKLDLKYNGKDLITTTKLYDGQVQIDVDRWVVVPGPLKDKVKILKVINVLLHEKMEISSFSTAEKKSYKKVGNTDRNEVQKQVDEFLGAKFKKGDKVYVDTYGEGKVIEFFKNTSTYKIQFSHGVADNYLAEHIRLINEKDIISLENWEKRNEDKREKRAHHSQSIGNPKFHDDSLKREKTKEVINKKEESTYKIGTHVFNKRYGEGVVYSYNTIKDAYRVRFAKYFHDKPLWDQFLLINPRFLEPYSKALDTEAKVNVEKESGQVDYKTDNYENKRSSEGESVIANDNTDTKEESEESGIFRIGERVYNKIYGKGIVLNFYPKIKDYRVRFYEKFHNLAPKNQAIIINEKFLSRLAAKNEGTTSETYSTRSRVENHKTEHRTSYQVRREKIDLTEQKDNDQRVRKFKVGDKIYNKKYGRGKIIELIPNSNVYQVRFPFYKENGILHKDKDYFLNEKEMEPLTYQIVESLTMPKESDDFHHTVKYTKVKQVKSNNPKFRTGDKVYSNKYGVGVIKQYYNYSKTYDIEFSDFAVTGKIHNLREDRLEPYKEDKED